jgi:coenzyme F420-dependent glucose-6-phosphate dehydrogenase
MRSQSNGSLRLGYALSSEEHRPLDLVRYAKRAEEAGFPFALISDHYHPWIERQGESPFVWNVLGGIAAETERLRIGTGVTCPLMRTHPAVIAQAAATTEAMMPGRFFLGVGTGENLNEHILGRGWPSASVRLEMLEEAIEIIRRLFEGGLKSHRGRHYTVEDARLYTLPDEPPPIVVAAGGPAAGELAGRVGDGLVGTSPDPEVIAAFDHAGGSGKPRYGQVTVCWAEDEEEARRTAYEWWPNAALRGPLAQELPLPSHFEEAAAMVDEADVAETIVCGPDPERHLEAIRTYADAAYDHVYVHQVGPDQDGFFDFYEAEILPQVAKLGDVHSAR